MTDFTQMEVLDLVAALHRLRGANLTEIKLSESYLQQVNLCRANLRCANFSASDLCGANLCEAHLESAKYSATNTRWPYGFRPEAAGAVVG